MLVALETKEQGEMVYSKECVPFPCQTTPKGNNDDDDNNNNNIVIYIY